MGKAPEHVLVVGGGVVGAVTAYYLTKAGSKVTLIDRGEFGMGCSHANCGFVSPSHVLPLAQPGAVGRTLKAMFKKNSPFYIKPRMSPTMWRWLWKFWKRCNNADMLQSARGIHALLQSSRALFNDFIKDENLDCDWDDRGLIFVHQTTESFEHFAHLDAFLKAEFDMGATPLPSAELERLEPALKPGLGGGWLYPQDAHLRSDRLMPALKSLLERKGVTIREGWEFRHLTVENGIATSVELSHGRMKADAVVMATGAWTPLVEAELGCKIPIQPGKGYSITMPRPKICPKFPVIFEQHRVAITPWQSGYRIGSTMEFAGYDTRLNRNRLEMLKTGAAIYLKEPVAEPIQEEWYGWRPMTYDSRPIIDFAPRCRNVVIAAGHSMLGLSMATGTGKLVTELLSKELTHIDPQPYSVSRF